MKNRKTVFYDNTNDNFEETRQLIFELQSEENGWDTVEHIPDSAVYAFLASQNETDWAYFRNEFTAILQDGYYLLTGTCGRWNGPAEGGKFIHNFNDFLSCIGHLDYIRLYDLNGHFYITGSHHDGSDRYELKRLTNKGYALAERNYFAHDRQLHKTLMNCNFYTALPRFAKQLYGV